MDSVVAARASALVLQIDHYLHGASAFINARPRAFRNLRAAALLVTVVVAGKFVIENLQFWATLGRQPLGLDFAQYRSTAVLGMRYGWNHLYDVAAQQRVYAEQAAAHPGMGVLFGWPNVYTPPASWLAVPITFLPLELGYVIWAGLLFVALVFAFLTLAPGGWPAKVTQLVLALCPFAVIFGLAEAQVTSYQLAGVAAAWLALRRGRDGWAGVALLPLALKPQTLLLVPFALLAAGRVRVFGAWFVATAVLGVVVLAAIGLDGAIAYAHRLSYANSHAGEFVVGGVYTWPLHFTTGRGRLVSQGLIVVLTMFVAWRHRRMGVEIPIAAGLVGSLLATSFLHINDIVTLFPAGWLILRARPQLWMWVLAAGTYVVVLLCSATGTVRWGEVLVLTELSAMVFLAVIPVPSERTAGPGELDVAQDLDKDGAPVKLETIGAKATA